MFTVLSVLRNQLRGGIIYMEKFHKMHLVLSVQ